MSTEDLLDRLLIPRSNGSEGLQEVAGFIQETLRAFTPEVALAPFTATPHGSQLLCGVTLLFMLGFAISVSLARYGLALALAAATAVLLALEMEFLWSPVSGLMPLTENNIVATFAGSAGGPTLIFSAHYDTATQWGDHITWGHWAPVMGASMLGSVALAVYGLWRRRRGRVLSRALTLTASSAVLTPFVSFFLFFSVGPLVRAPSPGALDNGGSLAVLLKVAERLATRGSNAPTTVKLVFLAGEEERALGSWHFARGLSGARPLAVVNLEILGASDELAYVSEEGFLLRSFAPSPQVVELVGDRARVLWGTPLRARRLPGVMYTDGRSFLAHGIPAVTLMSATDGGPRGLHSASDSRDRLSIPALERAVNLLEALVRHADQNPGVLESVN